DACHDADLSLTLLMESSTEAATVDRLIERTVRSHHVDGLIVSTALTDDVLCRRLMADGFPFVCIGQDDRFSHSFVDVDNRAAAQLAVEHLIAHGHRSIAMISGHTDIVAARSRQQGYVDALEAAGLPIGPIRSGEFNEYRAFVQALELLSLPDRPDAIFASSDAMAIGILRAAQSLGLEVPEDLAVMGFDGFEADLLESHRLSTVSQPARLIGRRAVELLVELISDPSKAPLQEVFPVELHLGTTCGGGHDLPADDAPALSAVSAGESQVAP
ncbi:MAG: substrate-binding domain-containing protein, partial [Thermomicrobiales bacterium]